MKNGNSGSGAAVAVAENAVNPIAIVPKAAARRVLSLNELSIDRPLLLDVAPFLGAVGETSTDQAFQDICTKSPKWFRGVRELFH
jgi:hypothetical protein